MCLEADGTCIHAYKKGMMHDVPGVYVNEYEEIEEPPRYIYVHYARLLSFIWQSYVILAGGYTRDPVPRRYEIVFLQDPVHRCRGQVCNISVHQGISDLPE